MNLENEMEDELEVPSYHEFRTGLTFKEVYQMLKYEARRTFESEGRRMFITRHTVLGRWRQIKQEMYEHHKRYVRNNGSSYLDFSLTQTNEKEIPF